VCVCGGGGGGGGYVKKCFACKHDIESGGWKRWRLCADAAPIASNKRKRAATAAAAAAAADCIHIQPDVFFGHAFKHIDIEILQVWGVRCEV
jgi:hypothetical protein